MGMLFHFYYIALFFLNISSSSLNANTAKKYVFSPVQSGLKYFEIDVTNASLGVHTVQIPGSSAYFEYYDKGQSFRIYETRNGRRISEMSLGFVSGGTITTNGYNITIPTFKKTTESNPIYWH